MLKVKSPMVSSARVTRRAARRLAPRAQAQFARCSPCVA